MNSIMQPDLEHIKTLILKELAGSIEAEEQLVLNKTLAESTEATILRKKLYDKLGSGEVNLALEDLQRKFYLDNNKRRQKKERKATVIRITAGIAAVLVIATGIYQMKGWNHRDKPGNAHFPNSTYVQLRMANGGVINLEQKEEHLNIDNLVLNNINKTLTYSSAGQPAAGLATLTVPDGKDYTIHLSDGTVIHLNSATTVQFPFSFTDKNREITVIGEAYLKVAKKENQPFIVHINNGPAIQVLGTEFNINTYDESEMRVSLVEGAVKLKTENDSIRLKPGFEAAYKQKQSIVVREFEADEVLSWRRGIQEFKGATLQQVFAIFPRWYGVEIAVDNPEVNTRIFTGSLDRNKSVDDFLEGLKWTHGIEYFRKDGIIHIK